MLFNLKEAAELGRNEGTNVRIPSETMTEMNFAPPANPQRSESFFRLLHYAEWNSGNARRTSKEAGQNDVHPRLGRRQKILSSFGHQYH